MNSSMWCEGMVSSTTSGIRKTAMPGTRASGKYQHDAEQRSADDIRQIGFRRPGEHDHSVVRIEEISVADGHNDEGARQHDSRPVQQGLKERIRAQTGANDE